MDAQYSLDRDGQRYGPYSLDELRTYLAQGSVIDTDMVWTAGMASWISVSQLLAGSAPAPPPRVAPPRQPVSQEQNLAFDPPLRAGRSDIAPTPAFGSDARAVKAKTGGVPVIVVVIIVLVGLVVMGGIVAAIAVPALLRARMSGNEASAIGSLRAINSAQAIYASQCGGYAPSLAALNDRSLLPADLAGTSSVVKSGYTLAIEQSATASNQPSTSTDCSGVSDYIAYADPVGPGTTGVRHFATDATGTIFQDATAITGGAIPFSATPIQ